MNPTTSVPFESKTLVLKQVSVANLEEIERRTLAFYFPGYHQGAGFENADLADSSPLRPFQDAKFSVIRDKNQSRRYAGDYSLPRSSYFTVCRTSSGDDGGLLLRELGAYAKPHVSGMVVVLDTTDPTEEVAPLRAMLKSGKSALFLFPQEPRHFPSPFRKLVGGQAQGHAQITAVIPTQILQVKFDQLIDLRTPSTRRWFTTELTRLTNDGVPARNGTTVTLRAFPLAAPLERFEDLLPTLLTQALGGGRGVTDIAGRWLRQIGADGLIFPSARADVSVTYSNGILNSWYGWNLVDYRSAPPPKIAAIIDLSTTWDKHPTTLKSDFLEGASGTKTTPVEFSHVKISATESGSDAGSLGVDGIELARGMYHDLALWSHYTARMGADLERSLNYLTSLAASDGKNRIYIDRLAGVARTFLAALHGQSRAKEAIIQLSSLPQVAAEGTDCEAHLRLFLSLCD